MKKILLFLSSCALLAACNSGYKPDEADRQSAAGPTPGGDATLRDTTVGTNLAAVAHQPQVDTSVNKIGTDHSGGLVAHGAELIKGSDCLGCHKEDVKLVGPAYIAVAEKYPDTEANIAMLANRVIKGGSGHWGEIPMSPHPNLSETDAREMTKYILSLK